MRSSLGLLGVVSAVVIGSAPNVALACGGCFAPVQQSSPTVVAGHRMAVSLSSKQTVLWDQIQYSGDPGEFAWVLPVKPGAEIQASTSAFFEVLEAASQRRVLSPPEICNTGNQRAVAGCASFADSGGADLGSPSTPTVTVVHEGTVGPYETVTLQTSTPGALNQWLSNHSFNVDPASQPVIDGYVAEGFDFIALRLQPGQGVRQMTPVRVVMPGGGTSLPLRMVAIGTGAFVPIVLYVIGDGRWKVQNFPEAHIQTALLSYDFATKTSNYADLRSAALRENGGLGWLTAYAETGSAGWLADSGTGPDAYSTVDLPSAYAAAAFANGETRTQCNLHLPDTDGIVVNPCPAGVPYDSPQCGTVPAGDVDIRSIACNGADDLGVAFLGRTAGNTWLTRLEANLPHSALAQDLVLTPGAQGMTEPRTLTATIAGNTDQACGTTVIFPRPTVPSGDPRNGVAAFAMAFLGAIAAALAARRRKGASARQSRAARA